MEEKTAIPNEEANNKSEKGYYSLDEINEQFLKSIAASQDKNIVQKKALLNKSMINILIIIASLIIIAAIILWQRKQTAVSPVSAPNQQASENFSNETDSINKSGTSNEPDTLDEPDTLNESGTSNEPDPSIESSLALTEIEQGSHNVLTEEEQQKWISQEIDLDGKEVYIQLNCKIYLVGTKAYISLINPIYSIYYYTITIYPREAKDTILYQSEMLSPGTILEAIVLQRELSESEYEAVVEYKIYDLEGNELGLHSVNVEFTTDQQYK